MTIQSVVYPLARYNTTHVRRTILQTARHGRCFHQPSTATTTAPPPQPLRLVLIGAPGSGKGTVSNWLRRDFGMKIVSSGDVLRSHIRGGTDVGRHAEQELKSGALVSDGIMLRLMAHELDTGAYLSTNFILDGFPRTVGQARGLDEYLRRRRRQPSPDAVTMAINMDVPEEILLDRLTSRWIHAPSGRVYNLSYNPPKQPFTDDLTGEPLIQRDDDRPEIIRKRLQHYQQLTLPLLSYYERQGKLLAVRGRTSLELYNTVKAVVEDQMATSSASISSNSVTTEDDDCDRTASRLQL